MRSPYKQVVLALDIAHDGLVHFVPGNFKGGAYNALPHGYDGYVGGAATYDPLSCCRGGGNINACAYCRRAGSSITNLLCPQIVCHFLTARCSTSVAPLGTHTITRAFLRLCGRAASE